jgi:hypothetical protein
VLDWILLALPLVAASFAVMAVMLWHAVLLAALCLLLLLSLAWRCPWRVLRAAWLPGMYP